MPPGLTQHPLVPHPATPQPAVHSLVVDVDHGDHARLLLRYRLAGALDALQIPAPASPARADDLWRHTCFEAFIAPAGAGEYWEFNFSPSRAWAAWHFTGCRTGMTPLAPAAAPFIAVAAGKAEFSLAATLDLGWLAQTRGFAGLRLGLTAVIEDRAQGLSYWALQHVAEKPDFHRAESFVVALA
jgi:hypothetical protein